jgi:hypothetical protein
MTFLSASTLSIATLLVLFSGTAHAGPCEHEIYDTDIALNKKLDAEAARGKAAPETQGALLHHQPTPLSVAGAEEKVGDISEADLKTIRTYMEEARKADAGGDLPACHKALADARQMLGL